MTLALGLGLGTGVLLLVSPWIWPRAVSSSQRSPLDRVRQLLAQAGLERISVGLFVAVSAALGVAAAAVVGAVIPVFALALAAGAVGAATPVIVVARRARRRRRLLQAAWPDLVDHLVAGVRAGQSLPDAVAALADVGPLEVRDAFRDFDRVVRATGTAGAALDELKDRLADPVADRIIETLRMSREVGGTELPAVLRALGASLRESAAVRSEVEARQSWVLNAARLGVAAPWIVLLMLATRAETAAAYNSPPGLALLISGFAVTVVAYRLMIALGRLPDEPRWFA